MDSQLLGIHSFTTFLQEGEESYNDYLLTSLNDLESQVTPPNPKPGTARKTKSRQGNFSLEDDNLLVSAWLNTSLDPINGVNQSKHSFWARVHEYYEKNKKPASCERSFSSLTNRWSTIQHASNKFYGALAQFEGRSPSGVTEQDKIEQAKELYRSNQSATFDFLHCWTILRHHPKWKQTVAEGSSVKTKTRSVTPDGHVPAFPFLDEGTISPSIDMNLERPIGKKAKKKRKRQDNTSSNLVDLVTEMREEKKRANAEKGKDRKELIRLTKERLELDQRREENELMRMDTSSLPPMQQEYFRNLQLEILEKKKSRKP
ncbi:hypothetical protein F2P56_022735 [Juglans regia]|uniref:No apical meristem-associated C-terminal domain-containing protein n=1 Tax=Juglans regia TaxID=51240 RepID=A0A833XA48_JUGRE|nr:hypothetical protein F2P56_022735 [Juglans regia]